MPMTRQEFLRLAAGAGAAVAGLSILDACSGTPKEDETTTDAGSTDATDAGATGGTDAGSNETTDAGSTDAGSNETTDAGTTQAACANGAADESISSNHGHSLAVPKADIEAAVEKTYDITGSAGHSHSVKITVEHFTLLAGGGTFTVASTGGSHTHQVKVACA